MESWRPWKASGRPPSMNIVLTVLTIFHKTQFPPSTNVTWPGSLAVSHVSHDVQYIHAKTYSFVMNLNCISRALNTDLTDFRNGNT